MTGSRQCIDSSAWISYFLSKTPSLAECIDSASTALFSSLLSVFEVKVVLTRLGWNQGAVNKCLRFIREHATLVSLDYDGCLAAADSVREHGLGAVDALIYVAARQSKATLVTLDNDFRGLPGTRLLAGNE